MPGILYRRKARRICRCKRNSLFEIARILEAKRPSYFILENVPGLLSHDKGRTFCTILSTLSELGYHVEWKVLNSKDFGVPKQENGCILSDILISDVPEKYYLNQKQMEQLLFKSGQEVREKSLQSQRTKLYPDITGRWNGRQDRII